MKLNTVYVVYLSLKQYKFSKMYIEELHSNVFEFFANLWKKKKWNEKMHNFIEKILIVSDFI